jgi:hypothetical protein
MELVILLIAVIGVLGWFLWRDRKFEDSGSHPLDGATKSPEPWPFPTARPPEGTDKETQAVSTTTSVLDVNKDGQVDLKDAVAAAEVVVEKTKKTAAKTKAVAKATATKVKTAVKKSKK